MAYNFKSIADVEVVAEPIESANILIEENGVIKKAPKTAVGGAGDTLFVAVDNNYNIISASDGFYEAISDMFDNIKFYHIIVYVNRGEITYRHPTVISKNEDHFSVQVDGGYMLNVYPNDELEYYVVD